MPEKEHAINDVINTDIPTLGKAKIPSPLDCSAFVSKGQRMLIHMPKEHLEDISEKPLYFDFEAAGPRKKLYFEPSKTKCAVVSCGGICPGTNDVIRAIAMEAHYNYSIAATLGIRFGLEGFIPKYEHNVMELTPESVSDIHQFGGTVLGSSRGPQSEDEIIDALERMNVNILFMIGGDGTMKAADKVLREITRRGLKISVIGIPKTIDNDISFIAKSFGFDTAVEKATEAIRSAHVEAQGAKNGIGMVKLMGRESGFIAAQATLALKEVNFVLVPEFPFALEGPDGLLPALEKRLHRRKHAVIVVAEGAGQHLIQRTRERDPSGNPVLGDICGFLKKRIVKYFKDQNLGTTLKFIDPSYIIRSVPANSYDRVYCGFLGQYAVHAAMAGKTGMVITKLMDRYIHLPFSLVTRNRRKINLNSEYWRAVMGSTGQVLARKKSNGKKRRQSASPEA